jgi:hypothetical protein
MSQFTQFIGSAKSEPRNFGLLFLAEEEYPAADFGTSAEVYLRSFTRAEYDKVTVTLRCGTFLEFEREIDRLHAELEHLREAARRKFAQLQGFEQSA